MEAAPRRSPPCRLHRTGVFITGLLLTIAATAPLLGYTPEHPPLEDSLAPDTSSLVENTPSFAPPYPRHRHQLAYSPPSGPDSSTLRAIRQANAVSIVGFPSLHQLDAGNLSGVTVLFIDAHWPSSPTKSCADAPSRQSTPPVARSVTPVPLANALWLLQQNLLPASHQHLLDAAYRVWRSRLLQVHSSSSS